MENDPPLQTTDWKNTAEAVANFRRLLLCSKCSSLMKDPVCLGMCEHMLCRSCAGPRAGDGCVVCHSPAWVKDIQINRQLSSIIQLFSGLESLLSPKKQADVSEAEILTQPQSPVIKHKRSFKIWFSPRSRKVRCAVEKPSEANLPDSRLSVETAAKQPGPHAVQHQELSVFNFTSSSQDSGSSSPERCNNENKNKTKSNKKTATKKGSVLVQGSTRTTRKQTKVNIKKKRLEDINEQWGITEDARALPEKEQPCVVGPKRSSKRVSFLSPAVTSDDPKSAMPQESTNEVSPARSTGESLSGGTISVQTYQTQAGQIVQQDKLSSNDIPEKQHMSSLEHSSKRPRMEEKDCTLENTPKRPRASLNHRRKSLGQMSPAALNPPSLSSPRCDKSSKTCRKQCADSPSGRAIASPESCGKSPSTPRTSAGRPSPGSPAFVKKNHKGETPLHLAAIKGDLEAVRELLDQGADPNLKDNAGWTPLHEACNLGHLAVVEVLISKGALLNTPGYENDSPLHDAVRNGHSAIVKVLLQLGASQSVLNLYGKRPADYAVSEEMLEIFQEASKGTQYANAHTAHSPSASLSVVSDGVRRDQNVVFLPTKLSPPEQHQLSQLGLQLGGRMVDTFTSSVSHVVVPEGQMPTTYSTLLGLLAGCWIVRYSWVKACLQAGKWMPEAEHEAAEGPQRSRMNRCSLLPPLFDGCFFFLYGSFKAPTKDELTKLIKEGGGQLLSRQPKPDSDVTQTLSAAAYHAMPGTDQALCTQYIIFDPQGAYKPAVVRRGKVWSAPSSWLIDCIAAFSLLPVPDL
ncbi:BRCA1-associated RING domain protein 1 isoform X2 [Parambassis ranga]|uniref:BRCA1-associated RING domain protein 1 isoform X2 n=1 Tax=Parambassis ranga TaxID=210632 RepID=A0A6P7HG79_9TELE|nr:BRCA1-associated RING domain protein 1 isoform X2 [Parambassis ranga]